MKNEIDWPFVGFFSILVVVATGGYLQKIGFVWQGYALLTIAIVVMVAWLWVGLGSQLRSNFPNIFFPGVTSSKWAQQRDAFSKRVERLAQEHKLEGKVTYREDWFPPNHIVTLMRIVQNEAERNLPLAEEFVREVESAAHAYLDKGTRYYLGTTLQFRVGSGMTAEDIRQAQKNWHDRCELFWAGAD